MNSNHTDGLYVDSFARAMKAKMAEAREKGRSGWEGMEPADLSRMLRECVEKGDPRDVANFCMMLWQHSARIARAPEAGAGEPIPAGWKLLPPTLTSEMKDAIVASAREHMDRTGGNSPDAMYEAAFEAAPQLAAAGEPVAYTSPQRLKRIAEGNRHVGTMWPVSMRDEVDIPLYAVPQPVQMADPVMRGLSKQQRNATLSNFQISEELRKDLATALTMSEAARTTNVPRYAKPPIGFVLEIGGVIRWQWAADTQAGAEGIVSRLHYNTAPADRKPYRIVPLVEIERIDRATPKGESDE